MAFTLFACLLFLFGNYFQKKYNQLGDAFLYLDSNKVHIGEQLKGKIKIEKKNFNQVKTVKLTNKKYKGGHYNNHFKKLLINECDCQANFDESSTWLHFNIAVPHEGRPTGKKNQDKYFWELSLSYIERLSTITRTWKININPAIENTNRND